MTNQYDITLQTELLEQVTEKVLDFIPLMDRYTGRHSFFMPGAIAMQKGYQSMEIIDTVGKITLRYGTV